MPNKQEFVELLKEAYDDIGVFVSDKYILVEKFNFDRTIEENKIKLCDFYSEKSEFNLELDMFDTSWSCTYLIYELTTPDHKTYYYKFIVNYESYTSNYGCIFLDTCEEVKKVQKTITTWE